MHVENITSKDEFRIPQRKPIDAPAHFYAMVNLPIRHEIETVLSRTDKISDDFVIEHRKVLVSMGLAGFDEKKYKGHRYAIERGRYLAEKCR